MTERREYDEATKAAVMAALLTGQSIGQVAKQYKIPEGTVKYWKMQSRPNQLVDPQKKDFVGSLLFDYLVASLRSLRIQAEHFGDTDWLAKQSASDLAVLHGVSTDKVIRLLEALANPEGTSEG